MLVVGAVRSVVVCSPTKKKSLFFRIGPPNVPPNWLLYFYVTDVNASTAKVQELGGKLRRPVESMGNMGRFCVIEDPSGAICALFEAAKNP